MTFMIDCSGVSPCRMSSTARNAPHTLMFDSPRPVEPAAPTVLSQYWPAPMIGESPTRPAIFHAMPLVVVTELMSPLASTAFMLIVPHVCATPYSSYVIFSPPPPSPFGGVRRGAAFGRVDGCDGRAVVSAGSSHMSFALSRDFHLIHSSRDFSVRRFCSLNPILSAKRFASWPTSMMCSV